jgi:hypothetical protein
VISSVDFDDQSFFHACEIGNEGPDRELTTKLQSAHPAISLSIPQQRLGLGLPLSQFASPSDCRGILSLLQPIAPLARAVALTPTPPTLSRRERGLRFFPALFPHLPALAVPAPSRCGGRPG